MNAQIDARTRDQYSPEIHAIEDRDAKLKGVVVVDSTRRGPAVGGCRLWHYPDISSLHTDAMRLARGMTLKNALAGLPFGGGKAVIQMPTEPFDRRAMFEAFGRAVHALRGRYITAEDVGTTVPDMHAVRDQTHYVAGLGAEEGRAGGDPSPWTALGVFLSMQVAARVALGSELAGLRIAIQGAGGVGSNLAKLLLDEGASVIVSDLDQARLAALSARDGVTVVSPDAIQTVDADIYAPCAMGGAIDDACAANLRVKLICGGANNQLANPSIASRLEERGIAYVPDYVANAGGIINVAAEYLNQTPDSVRGRVEQIAGRIQTIMTRASAEGKSPAHVADELAREVLAQSGAEP